MWCLYQHVTVGEIRLLGLVCIVFIARCGVEAESLQIV